MTNFPAISYMSDEFKAALEESVMDYCTAPGTASVDPLVFLHSVKMGQRVSSLVRRGELRQIVAKIGKRFHCQPDVMKHVISDLNLEG